VQHLGHFPVELVGVTCVHPAHPARVIVLRSPTIEQELMGTNVVNKRRWAVSFLIPDQLQVDTNAIN
jgi:hypothetical protein